MDKKGNMLIIALISVLVITGITALLTYGINSRHSTVDMFRRVKSSYLAESAIDLQQHFLLNKLDNTSRTLIHDEGVLRGDVYLFDAYVLEEGFTDIDSEVSGFLNKYRDMRYIRGELQTQLMIIEPGTEDGLLIDNLVVDCPILWEIEEGERISYEDYICNMKDLKFLSTVKFLGGEYEVIFTVSGLKIFREPFKVYEDGIGVSEATVLTDDARIEIDSFQFLKGVSYGK